MAIAAARLRAIKSFDDLIGFLAEELDWPLEEQDFEALTFEYSPEELGLKDEDAAKVRAVHQLRPLQSGQPWGIFFVEFERKRLPVVVLRRILNHLVIKKRASANKAQRPAWHLHDLLFISAFGPDASDQREIAFAHFHQENGDLPTLRVLGWDGADTGLKLDYVAKTLDERLGWPENTDDVGAWRQQWSGAFRHRIGHVIRTADALAEVLAELARSIRDAARTMLSHESEKGPLTKLHKAFQTALIHDLSEADFADTYAQTITYGLLTAAISRTEMSEGRHGTALVADNVTDMVPITNPFLREMLETFLKVSGRNGGIDFDELGIQDVVELLRGDETDLPAILRDFGNRAPGEDPVIHFYEHFLAAYDKKLKVKRGVFYTPLPVVSYIVRSVHELLQTEFGIEDGLASTITWGEMARRHKGLNIPDGTPPNSPFVQVLDPAVGTGTFLVEVIDVIHRTLSAKLKQQGLREEQQRAAWNEYVPKHLLPRLHGYELMMAPYAIAHMKLPLKLKETGFTAWNKLGEDDRVRVYLTNALEPAAEDQRVLEGILPALAHEAQAVDEIKQKQRFTVVVGNPPYSIVSQNTGTWISSLMELYKEDVREERNLQPLSDDYVKFLRLGHFLVERAGLGVLSLITNHTYLTGVIHRGLRRRLLTSFDAIRVLDLHGSALLGLKSPRGEVDKNVFDIQQGVTIATFLRCSGHGAFSRLCRADLWGLREHKYESLLGKLTLPNFAKIEARPPFFFFATSTQADDVYVRGASVAKLFRLSSSGFVTGKDEVLIQFDKEPIIDLVEDLAKSALADSIIASRYGITDTSGWPVSQRRRDVARDVDRHGRIIRSAYRPFDARFTFFCDFLQRSRYSVFRHLLRENIALITSRLVKGEEPAHFFVTRLPVEKIFLSPKTSNNAFVFPLYCYSEPSQFTGFDARQSTIDTHLAEDIARNLGLAWVNDGAKTSVDDPMLAPDDLLEYAYAVFFSPTYRTRYAEFLKIDFPRLPLTSNLDLFRTLNRLGAELIALHLMESSKLDQLRTDYIGPKNPEVGRVGWSDDTVWLDAAATKKGHPAKPGKIGFRGVPQNVWTFHVGGYQVCEKWLKDRRGRPLSKDDIAHYQKIVVALAETIRLMGEIDRVIEQHGGWPGAFQGGEGAVQDGRAAADS